MDMSWLETSLARLEARLQALIEGGASSGLISRKFQEELRLKILQAMRAGVQKKPMESDPGNNTFIAPDLYTLVIPPAQAQALLTHPAYLDDLAQKLEAAALETGIQFANPPVMRVVADPVAARLHVQAQFSSGGMGDSTTARLEDLPAEAKLSQPEALPNAFLIVDGLQTFPLTQLVVNIGRDPANHLRLENPRVSRNHAQLRFAQGRFIIFDLDSTAGTFVNGVAVSSQQLNPGDVISLAGVPLVFGQEAASLSGYTQELPAEPPPPEVL
jgi:FHA domain